MLIDTDKVVRLSDIGRMAGVSASAVSNWRKRSVGFPQPVATLSGWGSRGHALELFDRDQVEQWLAGRQEMTEASLAAREQRLSEEIADVRRRLKASRDVK